MWCDDTADLLIRSVTTQLTAEGSLKRSKQIWGESDFLVNPLRVWYAWTIEPHPPVNICLGPVFGPLSSRKIDTELVSWLYSRWDLIRSPGCQQLLGVGAKINFGQRVSYACVGCQSSPEKKKNYGNGSVEINRQGNILCLFHNLFVFYGCMFFLRISCSCVLSVVLWFFIPSRVKAAVWLIFFKHHLSNPEVDNSKCINQFHLYTKIPKGFQYFLWNWFLSL